MTSENISEIREKARGLWRGFGIVYLFAAAGWNTFLMPGAQAASDPYKGAFMFGGFLAFSFMGSILFMIYKHCVYDNPGTKLLTLFLLVSLFPAFKSAAISSVILTDSTIRWSEYIAKLLLVNVGFLIASAVCWFYSFKLRGVNMQVKAAQKSGEEAQAS